MSAILTVLGQRADASIPHLVTKYSSRRTAKKLRILVAEDNRVNQAVVKRMLEKLEHTPVIANNGREALSMLSFGSFDLVFMDVQMPEMDGLTATRTIREIEKNTGVHIPIVAMTAHAIKGDKERCLDAGMDGYVTKPVSTQGIEHAIAKILSQEPNALLSLPTPERLEPSALWDRSRALERVDGDESLLRDLILIFLEEAPHQLATLQEAIDGCDSERIERSAHSLKGELSYLGLTSAAQKAHDLELIGQEGTVRRPIELFSALKKDLSMAAAEMRQMLESGFQCVDL
jgi:CheY-like chemotaxis protein/HPt (histidine-containing phosphotransfer) domain-containing protein